LRRTNNLPSSKYPTACCGDFYFPYDPGSYILTTKATDSQGRPVVSAVTLTAYGEGDAIWHQNDGIRIELEPNKAEYLPGETANIVVKSTVHGNALVTVERDGVRRAFIERIKSDAHAISIPLTGDDTPNIFVSVMLIRGGADSPKRFPCPEYRLGYCNLAVKNVADRLAVNVTADEADYRPGAPVKATTVVIDHAGNPVPDAEVTVYAVDQGVLDLLPYQLPNPFAHFHREQRLAVYAGSSLDSLLAENPDDRNFFNKGTIIGGGGPMALPSGQLRKNFKACAFWDGNLITGEDGKAIVEFEAPDNLTEYHLFAVVAAGVSRFGGDKASFKVNKPLMLEPGLPRFANVGDRLVAKGIVHNTSPHDGEFVVTLEVDPTADHDSASGSPLDSRHLKLKAGETNVVTFPVTMKRPGEAVWEWSAQPVVDSDPALSELVDGIETRFQVTWPVPEFRESHYLNLALEPAEVNLLGQVNPELLEGGGTITLTLSQSPLINAQSAIDQVLHYPYGCVEQTTSSTLPWLTLQDLRSAVPGLKRSGAEVDEAIARGTKRLLSMQTDNGGLAYWPGQQEPMLWGSSYVGMALALAQKQGAELPTQRLERLCAYLSQNLRKAGGRDHDDADPDRCLADYTLALFGKAEPAYLEVLYKKRQHLSGASRAFLAMAILESGGSADWARELLTANLPEKKWHYHDPHEPTRVMAWSKLDPKSRELDAALEALLGARSLRGEWKNTYLNGWSLLALGEYTRATRIESKPMTLTAAFGTREEKIEVNPSESATVSFSFRGEESTNPLRIELPKDTKMLAVVDVRARPKLMPQGARSTGGFRITRTYEEVSPDGTPSPPTDLEIGDLVLVTLNGEVNQRSEYVVVDDALPSVLEAINPKFQTQGAGEAQRKATAKNGYVWRSNHQELRDDRALFFQNYIYKGGKFQIRYLARVIAEGTVTAPPAKIEAMYDPGKLGLSDSQVLTATTAAR
jgi:uncharacterized protein YfaS (alpha-2-macroglobulin family)